MPRPNFEDFRYTGASDETVLNNVVATRKHIYASTNEFTDTVEQKLATFLATPSDILGDEILVRMTEFADENGRPSGALFDSLIAQSTGRRVISTNLPGIDFYGDSSTNEAQRLTPNQAKDLRAGSFNKVGSAIIQAVYNATLEFDLDPKFVILGNSMSAAITASALNAAREKAIKIKGASFAEPINATPSSLLKLGMQFVMSGRSAEGYIAMNPEIVREVSEPIMTIAKRAMSRNNYLYATALANGSMIDDLGLIDHLKDVPIFMSRGYGSNISPEDGFRLLESHLSQVADVDAVVFGDKNNPHDHPYVLTVQSFIDAANNILERQ